MPPASGDPRAKHDAGVGPAFTSDVLVANLETPGTDATRSCR